VKEVALKSPNKDDAETEEKLVDCTFEQNEVYAVDLAMSSGDGIARPGELRTTIYKRNVEQQYSLKMIASRALLSEVDKNFSSIPFTFRHLQDVRKATLGIQKCLAHGLLTPYPSMHDHSSTAAHFKCTVLLLPSGGTNRVTGLDLPPYFTTTRTPDEETAEALANIEEEDQTSGTESRQNE
jgi:methionine aminopeptidase